MQHTKIINQGRLKMLHAPLSAPQLNTHAFTLKQTRNILNLIITGKFIKFRTPSIFCLSGSAVAQKDLEAYLEKIDWNLKEEELVRNVKLFVATYNVEHQSLPINSYVWACLAKKCFQNGCIIVTPIVLNDRVIYDFLASTYATWESFLLQLKSIRPHIENIPKASDGRLLYSLNPEIFELIMPEFISQLYKTGNHRAAEVIHNYMHLVYMTHQGGMPLKIEEKESNLLGKEKQREKAKEPGEEDDNPKGNGMDAKNVGVVMNPALLDGLELTTFLESAKSKIGVDYLFLGKVIELILAYPLPIFNTPYSSKFYRESNIKQTIFEAEFTALHDLLWVKFPALSKALKDIPVTVTETVQPLTEGVQNLSLDAPAAAASSSAPSSSERLRSSLTAGIKALFTSDKPDGGSPSRRGEPSPKRQDALDSPPNRIKKIPSGSKDEASSPPARSALIPRRPSPREVPSIDPRSSTDQRRPVKREISIGRLPVQEDQRQVTFVHSTSQRELVPQFPPQTFLPGYMVLVPITDGSTTPRPTTGAYLLHTTPVDVPLTRKTSDGTEILRVEGETQASNRNSKGPQS